MLKSLDMKDLRKKAGEALDKRVRIITAGMGINEMRAVMRGEPPTEKPNPRYKVHTTSFIFHIRPRYYEKASTFFTHTFRLGFFTSFLFFVELFTGLILMVYYVPTPGGAYQSILELGSNVPYGQFLRDMHRLAAEGMVIFTFLHMLRTFLTGSYKKDRTFTWLTGVFLLGITLFLSFFGYLLTWDQLALWAVTIGTSMADKVPLIGTQANLLLRGAPDIGAGGLLRAYLLHVILLPLAAILVISIHYYKVAREHGISMPAKYEEAELPAEVKREGKQRIDYIPDLLTHEVFLTSLGILILVVVMVVFGYHAPLEHIANPQQTPLDTKAPWYFWWLQGLLKLGDPVLMGVIIPGALATLLLGVPYLDRNPYRSLYKRPMAVGIGLFAVTGLVALSFIGTPQFKIETPAATRIMQDMAPEEGLGPLRSIPYDQLKPGAYEVAGKVPRELCPDLPFGCPDLTSVFADYARRVEAAATDTRLPDELRLPNAKAVLIVEDWQENLKKLTMRITWNDPKTGAEKTQSKDVYLHRDHGGE